MSQPKGPPQTAEEVVPPIQPGSDAAIAEGCTCPVEENDHGRGYMGSPTTFVITPDCPLHDNLPKP